MGALKHAMSTSELAAMGASLDDDDSAAIDVGDANVCTSSVMVIVYYEYIYKHIYVHVYTER